MTINCNGKLVDLSIPKIMGILNLTPDSFYDGGQLQNEEQILAKTAKMLSEGASFIDVGAYSSKPGASFVSQEEELKRIIPVIKLLNSHFPDIILSVDTFRSEVAKSCVELGAAIVNDISAGNMDNKMFATVSNLKVPYIMMHMQGTPKDMQDNPSYTDIVKELIFYFSEKITAAKKAGIHDIIVDPGFGFGKTLAHNYEVMNKLSLFNNLEKPLLIGVSRKSMIYKPLKTDAKNALNGSTCLHTIALMKGAKILRVHDVKEAAECVKLIGLLA